MYTACPVAVKGQELNDGRYILVKVDLEHQGHKVSQEQYSKYRKTRKITQEQEQAAMLMVSQGAEISDLKNMMAELLEREFDSFESEIFDQ